MDFPEHPCLAWRAFANSCRTSTSPDVAGAVRDALARRPRRARPARPAGRDHRRQPRHRQYPAVIRTVAGELRRVGAEPFVVPAMGSHGGATAEGQRAVLAEYGITEAEVGAPVLATMDTVELGQLADGDAVLHGPPTPGEADAIVVVGRVKAHTAFRGRDRERAVQDAGDRPGQAARRRDDPRPRPGRDDPGRGAGDRSAQARSCSGLALVENAYHQLHTDPRRRARTSSTTTDRELLKLANEPAAAHPLRGAATC